MLQVNESEIMIFTPNPIKSDAHSQHQLKQRQMLYLVEVPGKPRGKAIRLCYNTSQATAFTLALPSFEFLTCFESEEFAVLRSNRITVCV